MFLTPLSRQCYTYMYMYTVHICTYTQAPYINIMNSAYPYHICLHVHLFCYRNILVLHTPCGTPSGRGARQLKTTWGAPVHTTLSPALPTRPHRRSFLPKIPASRITSPANVVFVFAFGTKSAPKTALRACPGVALPAQPQLFVLRIA